MSSELKYWHLRHHKFFSLLNNEQIEDLCVIMNYKKAHKGEIIYFADGGLKRIFILKKGTVKIVEMGENGTEFIKRILQPGDLFGELSLDSSPGNFKYAPAISKKVVICSSRLKNFEQVLETYPGVALQFTRLIGFRFKKLRNSCSNLIFIDVKSRMNGFLSDWAGVKGGTSAVIRNYPTYQDIASLICATRQTVTQL